MFSHPLKAVMKVGEVTAAGLMKRVRVDPDGKIVLPDEAKATLGRKLWVAALIFLALVVLLTVLAA